jgi:carbonic anhydrase/acetyltransferase-like protein (isoleucine patch superfamily)
VGWPEPPAWLVAALPARCRARLALRRCAAVGAAPSVTGRVWIHGGGTIRLGARVCLDARTAPIELHAGEGGVLAIGDDVVVEGGASLEAMASVAIGDRVRVGAFAKILDNSFHPLQGDRHVRPASDPVVVEAGAEIGRRAILLPGARVAPGERVRPGQVVRRPLGAAAARPPPRGAR